MERVQFQQEQMLAELKDLAQKGLFSQKEIKQIMKKRTAFETALIRRVAKKGDYLRYIAYEIGLESLRKKRVERLKIPPGPPTVSDFALVKRQFHIFERALKKFKSDVALWVQYIEVANKEGARSLVGRITARALQLHPNTPALYILAAQHELTHLSPSAARSLLQRGIRLNKDSVEMWREYVKMELGFVESMRRRWQVLGIDLSDNNNNDKNKGGFTQSEKGKEKAREREGDEGEENSGDREENAMDVDGDKVEDTSDAARREIMRGAIVCSVITNAVKALPTSQLFTSLHELISSYPCPSELKESLLDHLHTLLQQHLPHDPQAIKLTSTRHLAPTLTGSELVDALRTANEHLSSAVRTSTDTSQRYGLGKVYAEFIEEWCSKPIDPSLKLYLISSLAALIQQTKRTIPPLLAAHLNLLLRFSPSAAAAATGPGETPSASTPASSLILIPGLPPRSKILKLAEKYTQKSKDHDSTTHSTSSKKRKRSSEEEKKRNSEREIRSEDASVWLARLNVERGLMRMGDRDRDCGSDVGDRSRGVGASGDKEKDVDLNEDAKEGVEEDVGMWKRSWKEARECVRGEGVLDVWLWGLTSPSPDEEGDASADQIEILETLLSESMQSPDPKQSSQIHETLLMRYISTQTRTIISSLHTSPGKNTLSVPAKSKNHSPHQDHHQQPHNNNRKKIRTRGSVVADSEIQVGTDLVGSAEGTDANTDAVGDEKASRAKDNSPGLETSSPSSSTGSGGSGGANTKSAMASLIAKAEKTDIRRRGSKTPTMDSAGITKLTNTVRRDRDRQDEVDASNTAFDRRVRELVGVVERRYFPSARVWEEMFALIARSSSSTAVSVVSSLHPQTQAQTQAQVETALHEIYTRWKCQDIVRATLGMARYYLEEGKGAKCVEVIGSVRDKSEKMEVEATWRGIVKDFDERRSMHHLTSTGTNSSSSTLITTTRNRNRNRNRDGDTPGKSDPKHDHHDHGIDGIEGTEGIEEEEGSDTADAGKGETQDEGDSSSESGSVREPEGDDEEGDGDEEDEMLIVQ